MPKSVHKAQLENSQAYKQAVQSQLIAAIANYYYSLAMLKDQLAVSQGTGKNCGRRTSKPPVP